MEDWSSNANDVITVRLVQAEETGLKSLHAFHPVFTYPIFGTEERIFGYRGLDIDLKFAAHDCRPQLTITYDKKFTPVGETKALDLNKILKDWIAESAFTKPFDFELALRNEGFAKDFRPPGTCVHQYSRNDRNFEVWAGPLTDPTVRAFFDRIQIFTSFFIEGGTPIKTDDPEWTMQRWTIYFVFEVQAKASIPSASPYVFVGFANTYRFASFQPDSPSKTSQSDAFAELPCRQVQITELPCRLRISQFILLPPFQHQGHGSALYDTIYQRAHSDSTIHELTVEDPNEEFDVLRDTCDHRTLFPLFQGKDLKINTQPYPPEMKRRPHRLPTRKLLPLEMLNSIRLSTKIAPRQFARLTEMYLLSLIPESQRLAGNANLTKIQIQKHKLADENDRAYYWWRMLVKQRVYKKNRDLMIQMDKEDRYGKLEESLQGIELEYMLLLSRWEGWEDADDIEEDEEEEASTSKVEHVVKKRKIVDDDEDEDMDGTNGASSLDPEPKRTKV
ncbi:MAG: hypothetical protein Q9227_003172 [Pyrenula ochraceoflavens]